jgi:hypothetical protein
VKWDITVKMESNMNAQEGHLDIVLVSAPRISACLVDEDTIAQAKVVIQVPMPSNFPAVLSINFVPTIRPCHRVFPLGSIRKVEKDLVTTLFFIELIKRYARKEVSAWEECGTSVPEDHMVSNWD